MHVYSPYASIGYGLSAILRGTCEDRLSGMEKIMMDKELERLFECRKPGPENCSYIVSDWTTLSPYWSEHWSDKKLKI